MAFARAATSGAEDNITMSLVRELLASVPSRFFYAVILVAAEFVVGGGLRRREARRYRRLVGKVRITLGRNHGRPHNCLYLAAGLVFQRILAVLFEVRVLVELGVDPKRVARKRTRERNDTSNVRMGNNVRYDLLGWPSFLP